jgi:hypothetical protein
VTAAGLREMSRACPPNAATVPLDDGVADGQPDAHTVTLRHAEGIEQLVDPL